MSKEFRIILRGPHCEKDYLEKILSGGVPCICGDDVEYAGVFPEVCAKNIKKNIEKNWLHPHVAVELELID